MKLLDARNDKRIPDNRLVDLKGYLNGLVLKIAFVPRRVPYGIRLAVGITGVLHDDVVLELGIIANLASQCLAEYVNVLLFKIFIKERTRHLDGQDIFLKPEWNNGFKPGLETGRRNYVTNYFQTIIPDLIV